MQKLGGMSGIMGMLPGVGKMKKQMSAANAWTTRHDRPPARHHRHR
jgi:signal recognition particle GTPase